MLITSGHTSSSLAEVTEKVLNEMGYFGKKL